MAIVPQPTTGLPFRLGVADLNHHEYFDGEVFAMTGGSLPHADIALNIATYLRSQLGVGLTVPMAIIYEDVVLVQSPATQRYYQPPIAD